jgi:MSHA pilin protein MshD
MFNKRQGGMSLIEVVIFIVVLGIGFAGILVLYNQVTRASVDPLVRKQALAIASSLLEEIELRPFTYCDPDDAKVFTAASTADCTAGAQEVMGPDTLPASTAETRYGGANPQFDNVNDYHNFSMGAGTADPEIRTVAGDAIADLERYRVLVSIAVIDPPANTELPNVADVNDALRITVTATHPETGVTVSLQGYRLRYAPNSP